jgi:hypothetical protein
VDNAHDLFAIERHEVERLKRLARRLYTEDRMGGDEMRDAAQLLDYIADHAIPLDEPGGRRES